MVKINRLGARVAACAVFAGTVPLAHAGWVEALCREHKTPQVCQATLCSNVASLCTPPDRKRALAGFTSSAGGSDISGGTGTAGSNERKAVAEEKLRSLTDRQLWSAEELGTFQRASVAPGEQAVVRSPVAAKIALPQRHEEIIGKKIIRAPLDSKVKQMQRMPGAAGPASAGPGGG